MVMIPVSFVLATVILILLWREFQVLNSPERNYFLIAFLALIIFQLVLVGLRFGYGLEGLRRVYPFGASLMGPLAFLSFYRYDSADSPRYATRLVHLMPLLVVCLVIVVDSRHVDLVLGVTTLVYAGLLTRLGLKGHDGLGWASLSRSVDVFRTLWFCAVLLVLSGITDLLIALDFLRTGGSNTDRIVSKTIVVAFMWFLLALLLRQFLIARRRRKASLNKIARSGAAVVGGHDESVSDSNVAVVDETQQSSKADAGARSADADPMVQQDQSRADLLKLIVASIQQQNLHLDPDLNLSRLARRIGVVQRQVSEVINSETGKSVSQFINGMRVDVACEKLTETDMSVTEVMLASGFNTKSNFNREFKRCTNMSPSAYRKSVNG